MVEVRSLRGSWDSDGGGITCQDSFLSCLSLSTPFYCTNSTRDRRPQCHYLSSGSEYLVIEYGARSHKIEPRSRRAEKLLSIRSRSDVILHFHCEPMGSLLPNFILTPTGYGDRCLHEPQRRTCDHQIPHSCALLLVSAFSLQPSALTLQRPSPPAQRHPVCPKRTRNSTNASRTPQPAPSALLNLQSS